MTFALWYFGIGLACFAAMHIILGTDELFEGIGSRVGFFLVTMVFWPLAVGYATFKAIPGDDDE